MKDEGMDVKGEDMDTCIKVRVWTWRCVGMRLRMGGCYSCRCL